MTSKCRLLIQPIHAVAVHRIFSRTPHHPLLTGDAKLKTAYAALATAAAPTFSSAAKVGNMMQRSTFFLMVGVWANSPHCRNLVRDNMLPQCAA